MFSSCTTAVNEELGFNRYGGGIVCCDDRAALVRASGRASAGVTEIVMEQHAVLRYTPCGAWIDTWTGDKFVNLRAGKQWASTTEAEAIDQLYHRKRTQVRILTSRLEEAKTVQEAMEKHLGKKPPAPRRYSSSEWDYY